MYVVIMTTVVIFPLFVKDKKTKEYLTILGLLITFFCMVIAIMALLIARGIKIHRFKKEYATKAILTLLGNDPDMSHEDINIDLDSLYSREQLIESCLSGIEELEINLTKYKYKSIKYRRKIERVKKEIKQANERLEELRDEKEEEESEETITIPEITPCPNCNQKNTKYHNKFNKIIKCKKCNTYYNGTIPDGYIDSIGYSW